MSYEFFFLPQLGHGAFFDTDLPVGGVGAGGIRFFRF